MKLEDRLKIYKKVSYKLNEEDTRKITKKCEENTYDYEIIYLIENIPNWQQYLTPLQAKVLELYKLHRDIDKVANIIDMSKTACQNVIIGKEHKGIPNALQKLRSIWLELSSEQRLKTNS